MDRRGFITGMAFLLASGRTTVRAGTSPTEAGTGPKEFETLELTEAEWRKRLTPEQFYVLRREGTERAFTSPLNDEKRKGVYACAGCGLELFESDKKYDSGTGWPSFYDVIPGRVGTKRDYKLFWPRTEYHCARCGGHHGHVFEDGPQPTGLRYCNNGVALTFVPAPNEAIGEPKASGSTDKPSG